MHATENTKVFLGNLKNMLHRKNQYCKTVVQWESIEYQIRKKIPDSVHIVVNVPPCQDGCVLCCERTVGKDLKVNYDE